FHFLQTLNRAFYGLEVGHHATQPTAVHIRHAATCSFFGDDFASSALGAHKQDGTATSSQLAHELGSFLEFDDSVFEVDDMNFVTLAKDVRCHLGIPVTCLVTKMDTGFQHFSHQGHNVLRGL